MKEYKFTEVEDGKSVPFELNDVVVQVEGLNADVLEYHEGRRKDEDQLLQKSVQQILQVIALSMRKQYTPDRTFNFFFNDRNRRVSFYVFQVSHVAHHANSGLLK